MYYSARLTRRAPEMILDEFKKFAVRGNLADLAAGIVIGAAFTGVVSSS
jgi:large conductance mechanosensitive channel